MRLRRLRKCLLASAFVLAAGFSSQASADLVVELGSVDVDISAGTGTVDATFNIAISNPTGDAAQLAGYTLFLDIGPAGRALPTGVSYGTPQATYLSGGGVGLLTSGSPGTLNSGPTLAAGDLGLGQFQFFDSTLPAGSRFDLITVNLVIDRAVATEGTFDIFLNPDGQTSISSFDNFAQEFTSTSGTLTLFSSSAIPEPGSLVILAAGGLLVSLRRKRNT